MVVVQRGDVDKRALSMDLDPFVWEEYDLTRDRIQDFHQKVIALREEIFDALPSWIEKRGGRPLPNPLRRRRPPQDRDP
jgi:hypothetical protein